MTPFLVTTTHYPKGSPMPSGQTRQAFEDLSTATAYVRTELCDHHGATGPEDPFVLATLDITESGGIIGPLSDRTMFDVRAITEDQLRAAVAPQLPGAYSRSLGEIAAAYNAAQG